MKTLTGTLTTYRSPSGATFQQVVMGDTVLYRTARWRGWRQKTVHARWLAEQRVGFLADYVVTYTATFRYTPEDEIALLEHRVPEAMQEAVRKTWDTEETP